MSHHDIAALLTDFYASFAGGSASGWADHVAEDALCIGTDEDEWVDGRAAILAIFDAQLPEMSAAGISLTGGDAVVREHGELVVISDRPTIHLADGSSQALRVTVAARRADGKLLVHQMHLSAPAPNDEVVQTDLTLPTA